MEPINRSRDLERILENSYAKPAPLSSALIKSITDDFSRSRNIGSGGFGDVYLGVLENGKKVAVKKLTSTISNGQKIDPDQLFESESDCFMRAKHENIVRLLGYCADTPSEMQENSSGRNILVDKRKRFLCLEHAPNGDLQHYIEAISHSHDWRIYYQMIMGICQGLKYLHEKQIIHLDLKPKNILLDAYMRTKITDFGLSRCFDEGQYIAIIEDTPGTPGFIAPEILERKEISYKADIFALGVIVVRLLMGNNSNNYSMKEWLDSVDVDTECPQVKKCFIDIARTCTQHDQDNRPTIQQLILKLDEMVSMMPELGDPGNIYDSDSEDVIKVDPLEMRFRIDAENGASSSLNLVNFTDEYVAYKISKKNSTIMYTRNIIGPRRTCVIDIKREESESMQCDDRFLVHSTVVTQFFDTTDFTDDMFERRDGRRINEVEVGSVAATPSQLELSEELNLVTTSGENSSKVMQGSIAPLDIHPSELHIPFEPNKCIPCLLHLTNKTDKLVRFKLSYGYALFIYCHGGLEGIVPPNSTYSIVLTTKRKKVVQDTDFETLTLKSSFYDEDSLEDDFDDSIPDIKLKAVHRLRGELTYEQATPNGMKFISTMVYPGDLKCVHANPREPWVATVGREKFARIMNYDTEKPTGQSKVTVEREDFSPKFIAQEEWIMAPSPINGCIDTYNYKMKKIGSGIKVGSSSKVTDLVVHPTKLSVLSICSPESEMKLWDWDKGWNWTQTFVTESGTYRLNQVLFNPKNTKCNSVASAWDNGTTKFWDRDSPHCSHTLFGHKDEVYCLDFFTREDQQQYLITGSKDKTAKIWDVQKMTCVHTLEGFESPVFRVFGHPNLPLLITGTKDGIVHVWSSTDFRLKAIFHMGCSGKVLSLALACPVRLKRVVIGQEKAVSILDFRDEGDIEKKGLKELEASGFGVPERKAGNDIAHSRPAVSPVEHLPQPDKNSSPVRVQVSSSQPSLESSSVAAVLATTSDEGPTSAAAINEIDQLLSKVDTLAKKVPTTGELLSRISGFSPPGNGPFAQAVREATDYDVAVLDSLKLAIVHIRDSFVSLGKKQDAIRRGFEKEAALRKMNQQDVEVAKALSGNGAAGANDKEAATDAGESPS